jgi:predicted DCC family thiol-disulfide oxidoreductase YuxK
MTRTDPYTVSPAERSRCDGSVPGCSLCLIQSTFPLPLSTNCQSRPPARGPQPDWRVVGAAISSSRLCPFSLWRWRWAPAILARPLTNPIPRQADPARFIKRREPLRLVAPGASFQASSAAFCFWNELHFLPWRFLFGIDERCSGGGTPPPDAGTVLLPASVFPKLC